jgi:hypothetical protein
MKSVKTYFKPIQGISVIITFILALICFQPAFAALDLRIRPYEGGYDLSYHRGDLQNGRANKEVVFDITNDTGKQYRLIQVLAEPLTNEQGISMPQNSLVVYALRGSNKYGNLSVETDTPVFLGRQILYTSNQNGLSDSFILVYGLLVPPDQEPGYYRGRLAFTVEPVDSLQDSRTVFLNISAEIEAESHFEIITCSQDNVVHLDSSIPEKQSCEVAINMVGGLGRQFRITQLLSDPIISADGEELDPASINFIARDASEGTVPGQDMPLSLRPQVIYNSGSRGQADSFTVTYSLGDLSGQKAGHYAGNIKYVVDGASIPNAGLIGVIRLEVENPRVFDLSITPQSGSRIEFRDLKPGQLPKTYEVLLKVNSNIGRQYQVSQMITSPLVNKEGYEMGEDYFTCRTESNEAIKGNLKVPQNTAIKKQANMTLFVSDSKGSSDTFKVIYELTPPPDVRAGDYSTTLVYSLLEI